jgi:hypothetical protein
MMKLASGFALILVSIAAAISSLIAVFCAWGSTGIVNERFGKLWWHVDPNQIALSVSFAFASIMLLSRPTKPSLSGYKWAASFVASTLTTAFGTLAYASCARILDGENGLWTNRFDPGPIYQPLILTALIGAQRSICLKQRKQYTAYLATEKVLNEQRSAAMVQASGSWPPPPT